MLFKNHALKYIQSGFSIIPLKPREKNPLIKWARFQKTKPTEKEISTWWSRWPKANIGLITGAVNRLVVFDEDGEKAAKIIKEGGGLPPGPQSVTSKGRHYLFRHPGFSVQNDVNKKLDLDIRGDGGYIVAPPSVHPSGHVYSWAPGLSIFDLELPEMRPWQLEYIRKHCLIDTEGRRNPEGWDQEALEGVQKGARNDTAAKLAGKYMGLGLADEEVVALLIAWNRKNKPPLDVSELFTIVKSIRQRESRNAEKKQPETERSPLDTENIDPETLENVQPAYFFEGKRFVPQFLAKYLQIKFDPLLYSAGEFYRYNSTGVWRPLDVDALWQEGERAMDKWVKSARVEDALKILARRVYLPAQDFKHDPNYLNVQNGMIEIATVDLKEHDKDYLSRIQVNVKLDTEATCPRWDRFLKEIFPGSPEKAKALQSYLGYCLLPDCRHQRCLFLLGSGANGKSVVAEVLIEILGKENVASLALQNMSQRFLIGELKDKLVNIASEIATNQPTDTSVFKDAVAGGLLMADAKHGKPFSFYPICKHLFSMNEPPKITDKSYGFQRRPIVLTFTERFEGERRDPHLIKKLVKEKAGIFAWMLEGLHSVLEKDDLYVPEAVEADTKEFVKTTNPVLLFVEDNCVLGDEYKVKPKDLYTSYKDWCKEGSNRPLSRNRFYDQILIHFPTVCKKQVGEQKRRVYTGIGLQSGERL